jgi:hypothetical protein
VGKVIAVLATAIFLAPIIAFTTMASSSSSLSETAWLHCLLNAGIAYGISRIWDHPASAATSVLVCWVVGVVFEVIRLNYYGREFMDFNSVGVVAGFLGAPIGAIWSKWPERKP